LGIRVEGFGVLGLGFRCMHAGATADLAHGGVRHAEGDKLQEEAYVERQIIREGQPRRAPRQKLRASAPARVCQRRQ
jgi:hypothetical protein